jgi:hypothetical protein
MLLVAQADGSLVRDHLKESIRVGDRLHPLLDADSWRATAKATNEALRINLEVEFLTEEAAQEAVPLFARALTRLDEYFALSERRLPEFFEKQREKFKDAKQLRARMDATIKAARASLKGTAAVRKAKTVSLEIVVATKEPVTTAVLLLSLVPGETKP